ncbi:MAG TPA: CPBP family intramembrane glutamic endopeptidase, partial [Verrucomicrobiae bacterium]|nr:CPBP family intramembrane glutamic endopeptidase [Verrucomicrobiae bacterium]
QVAMLTRASLCSAGSPARNDSASPALLVFYASVSVTSQEFLYSSFFFWRYRPLFSPGFLVGLNAVVFGIAHMVYDSWVSVGLALAARVILARVYRRHGSFWGVWVLHLLLGVMAFLTGLGRYFYRASG